MIVVPILNHTHGSHVGLSSTIMITEDLLSQVHRTYTDMMFYT